MTVWLTFGRVYSALSAAAALVGLGYSQTEAAAALKGIDLENLSIEDVIRRALRAAAQQ